MACGGEFPLRDCGLARKMGAASLGFSGQGPIDQNPTRVAVSLAQLD